MVVLRVASFGWVMSVAASMCQVIASPDSVVSSPGSFMCRVICFSSPVRVVDVFVRMVN